MEFRSKTSFKSESFDDENLHICGYAIVFDQITTLFEYDGIEYKEKIDKHACEGAIIEDVPLKYNHNDSYMVTANTKIKDGEGSMTYTIDDKGVKIDAYLTHTQAGEDLYRNIKLGLIDKMSFAFTIKEQSYDSIQHLTTIKKFDRIYDFSAVDTPAYEQTSLSACRSKQEAKEQAKEQKLNNLKRKIRVSRLISICHKKEEN